MKLSGDATTMALASVRISAVVLLDGPDSTVPLPCAGKIASTMATAPCLTRAHARRDGPVTHAKFRCARRTATMVVFVSHQTYASAGSGPRNSMMAAKQVADLFTASQMASLKTLDGRALIATHPSVYNMTNFCSM